MSLHCSRSSVPSNGLDVLLYDYNNDSDHLFLGQPLLCSSISPPEPSRCEVCSVGRVLHAVCSSLSKSVQLVMEADNQNLDIIKSACPTLLREGSTTADVPEGNHIGALPWWAILILILILILIAIFTVVLVAFCTVRKRRTANNQNGATSAADPCEMNPMTVEV